MEPTMKELVAQRDEIRADVVHCLRTQQPIRASRSSLRYALTVWSNEFAEGTTLGQVNANLLDLTVRAYDDPVEEARTAASLADHVASLIMRLDTDEDIVTCLRTQADMLVESAAPVSPYSFL